ncbi:shugoshin 2 isoform X2 [Erinaceus europaeus]|uniref:Shugoshin 2 isoform X2 n=1 Tax=Erinaceus europaeus TaxID=9365 RepID=A0ABM3XMV2_ERIEU|nr:shugoshin 2 isoform X2 [Erinaceus europaeus]
MEYPAMETSSLSTSGMKKHVRDKRISKTAKLNVSLASKIKTKIINNSSIFKISLKHNNRALAQALSREKENSRKITTEKMLLQKEVEKLNFENTFLRLKLNNLNKKLIEIEALMSNNLLTAIEMSTICESSFMLPASKKKRASRQGAMMRLPFARVPLSSNDDDEEDGAEQIGCDSILLKASPDSSSSVSIRQALLTPQRLGLSQLKENKNDSEHISSIVDLFPKESHSHSNLNSKSSPVSKMKNAQSISHRKEKPSVSNVTERKKRASSRESSNPSAAPSCGTGLDEQISSPQLGGNNSRSDCADETTTKGQRDTQCLPDSSSEATSEPAAESKDQVPDRDDFQLQKTVYDTADMDLTAPEVSNIVVVSTGTKQKSNQQPSNCEMKVSRKVRTSNSHTKRERSKRPLKNSLVEDIEEKIKNESKIRCIILDDQEDLEGPELIFSLEQQNQLQEMNKISHHDDFDQDSGESKQCNRRIYVPSGHEKTYSFSYSSDKLQQKSKFDTDQRSLAYNKNKTSRQTFVIHKLESDNLFPNQQNKETISENLAVTNEFQGDDFSSKGNGKVCDYEAHNVLDFGKHVTDTQTIQKNESKLKKQLRQKVNRKTEIISEMNHTYRDSDQDVDSSEKGNFLLQIQETKETVSRNLEVYSDELQKPTFFTSSSGNLCDGKTQNRLDLKTQVTDMQPAQQSEIKASKRLKQKVNRKTEILSERNQTCGDNVEDVYGSARGSISLQTQQEKDGISKNLKASVECQKPLFTSSCGNLCDSGALNVLGLQKHLIDMFPVQQDELKVNKKHRQKLNRKTEIISEMNHLGNDKNMYCPEKDRTFSLTQSEEEVIPGNPEDPRELQTPPLSTRDHGDILDYETQGVWEFSRNVHDLQPPCQNQSKTEKIRQKKIKRKKTEIISEMNQIHENDDKSGPKKLGQKARQKTEIISEMSQTYGDNAKEDSIEDLDVKITHSKQRLECQGGMSGYNTETNSNEKEVYDRFSDGYKLDKNIEKESPGNSKTILTEDKNKPLLYLADSPQTFISLESGLKHSVADPNPGNQMKSHKNLKQTMTTLNKTNIPTVDVKKGECKAPKIKSKAKKRKIFIESSPDRCALEEIASDSIQGTAVESQQTEKAISLEDEKSAKLKSVSYKTVFTCLSEVYASNIQDSPFSRVRESSVPLRISSSENLIMKENIVPESSPIFQLSGDSCEKRKFNWRTQKSGRDDGALQDLTNLSFVSNNSIQSENLSEDLSELPSRRRRCAPLSLKEPSLRKKMRR